RERRANATKSHGKLLAPRVPAFRSTRPAREGAERAARELRRGDGRLGSPRPLGDRDRLRRRGEGVEPSFERALRERSAEVEEREVVDAGRVRDRDVVLEIGDRPPDRLVAERADVDEPERDAGAITEPRLRPAACVAEER